MDRIYRWNRWYEGLGEDWRFQAVLVPLLVLGAVNMLLTLAIGFPFGLLVLLGIAAAYCVRVPYALGWLHTSGAGTDGLSGGTRMALPRSGWVYDVNVWYDRLPTDRQLWVIPVVLLVAGAINMLLTLGGGFPFGLLFLLAVLGVVAIRGPYAAGWMQPSPPPRQPALPAMHLEHLPPERHLPPQPVVVPSGFAHATPEAPAPEI